MLFNYHNNACGICHVLYFISKGRKTRGQAIWARLTAHLLRLRNDTQICLTLKPMWLSWNMCHRVYGNLQFISITLSLIFFFLETGHILVPRFSDGEENFQKSQKLIFFLGKLIRSYYFPKYFWSIMFTYFIFKKSYTYTSNKCSKFLFNGRKKMIFLQTMR